MLTPIMENVLRWFTRGVHSLYGGPRTADGESGATFEHVDSAQLDARGFCASASMGLDVLPRADFMETLPTYARTPPPRRRAAITVRRGFV